MCLNKCMGWHQPQEALGAIPQQWPSRSVLSEGRAVKQYVSKFVVIVPLWWHPPLCCVQFPAMPPIFEKVQDLRIGYVAGWLNMLTESDGPLWRIQKADSDRCKTEAVLWICSLYAKNVTKLVGLKTTTGLVSKPWIKGVSWSSSLSSEVSSAVSLLNEALPVST